MKNLKAYDNAGNELDVNLDTESGEVEFSGEPAKITYDYDTGFENTLMDVEISALESEPASEPENHATKRIGSSGGCTSGFGVWALAILALCFSRKRI